MAFFYQLLVVSSISRYPLDSELTGDFKKETKSAHPAPTVLILQCPTTFRRDFWHQIALSSPSTGFFGKHLTFLICAA